MKIKSFECPKSIRNYEKKNTWKVRREPAYYIVDCRILSPLDRLRQQFQ